MNFNIKQWSLVAFILSTCSYLYELLLIQFAGDLSNNNFLIINLSLGIFILGLGLGLKDLPELSPIESITKLIHIERDLCLLALGSWFLIQGADFLQQHFKGLILIGDITTPWLILLVEKYHFYILISCIISSLVIGYKSGQELPLILKIANQNDKYTSFFFSLSYLGSVAASFGLNYLLKPLFPVTIILLLVISLNLIVYLILSKLTQPTKLFSFLGILLLIISAALVERPIVQFNLKNYFYHFSALKNAASDYPSIFEKDTNYQHITIHEFKNRKILSLNRQFQFSFENEDLYHDALIHIPLKLVPRTIKKVLLLGGGDGLALRELLNYPEIESIKQIELDEKFTNFCRDTVEIANLNQNSLQNTNKVKRIYGDAFYLVKQEKETFDLIVIDFPYPFSYDLWKLYSLEFYASVKKRMHSQSILILDAPVQNQAVAKLTQNTQSAAINTIMFSTLKASKFKFIEFFSLQKEGFILVLTEPTEINKDITNFNFLKSKTISRLPSLLNEKFIYQYDPKQINSIFEPKFLNFDRDF